MMQFSPLTYFLWFVWWLAMMFVYRGLGAKWHHLLVVTVSCLMGIAASIWIWRPEWQ